MHDQPPSTFETILAAAWKILPGALGAAVSLQTLPPAASWGHRVAALVGGIAASAYGAPALAEVLTIQSARIEAFSAFAIGLFGMAIASEIHMAIHESQAGLAMRAWIRRRLGVRK